MVLLFVFPFPYSSIFVACFLGSNLWGVCPLVLVGIWLFGCFVMWFSWLLYHRQCCGGLKNSSYWIWGLWPMQIWSQACTAIKNVIVGLCVMCHVVWLYPLCVGISSSSWLRLIMDMDLESGLLEMDGRWEFWLDGSLVLLGRLNFSRDGIVMLKWIEVTWDHPRVYVRSVHSETWGLRGES